jgi:hypothetical protein
VDRRPDPRGGCKQRWGYRRHYPAKNLLAPKAGELCVSRLLVHRVAVSDAGRIGLALTRTNLREKGNTMYVSSATTCPWFHIECVPLLSCLAHKICQVQTIILERCRKLTGLTHTHIDTSYL